MLLTISWFSELLKNSIPQQCSTPPAGPLEVSAPVGGKQWRAIKVQNLRFQPENVRTCSTNNNDDGYNRMGFSVYLWGARRLQIHTVQWTIDDVYSSHAKRKKKLHNHQINLHQNVSRTMKRVISLQTESLVQILNKECTHFHHGRRIFYI